ncbi:MAG: PadR family transcriptional regulator [Miniphocaeibacter sp.]|jgi:PadR family transcriptional regulator PadR|uniref:PadR family transcriptional regulator n=1 Tax=Miniphocaeibacter sp. TaxID=3100973 RepID=UPI0017FA22FE|nr:PadR family transcriptional regulator [Gallicola sp.]
MNTQLKKGVLELCVLAIINRKDSYGYEIVDSLAEFIKMSEGTIYPMLRRLAKDGYVATYYKESQTGPQRKYYKITDTGKEYLRKSYEDWNELVSGVKMILQEEKQ